MKLKTIFREAVIADLHQIKLVRSSVTESELDDPASVADEQVVKNITETGKGWVCEINGRVEGLAIVDASKANVWALFVTPQFERKGIGRELQRFMLSWYFHARDRKLWLSTTPGTRAENFYLKCGWSPAGIQPNGEIRFEMNRDQWRKLKQASYHKNAFL